MVLSWSCLGVRSPSVLYHKFPFAAAELQIDGTDILNIAKHSQPPLPPAPQILSLQILGFISPQNKDNLSSVLGTYPFAQVIRSLNMAYDATGRRNLTLFALQAALVKDLQKAAQPDLLKGRSLHYYCGRGDWKFKSAWLGETRDYGNLREHPGPAASFCRRCSCGSDLNHGHWLDVQGQSFYDPASVLQTLDANMAADLPLRSLGSGWSPEMEHADILHTLWIGAGRDCVGSVLCDIAEYVFLDAGHWDTALACVCTQLHDFCERHGLDKSIVEEIRSAAACIM